jgi:hypothetical protein
VVFLVDFCRTVEDGWDNTKSDVKAEKEGGCCQRDSLQAVKVEAATDQFDPPSLYRWLL